MTQEFIDKKHKKIASSIKTFHRQEKNESLQFSYENQTYLTTN